MIAGACAIIDESDDLIAEFAVFEDLVRDQTSQLARSRDENPLETDACAPPPFEYLAHQLARRERQDDVEHQEQPPDQLRDLEGSRLTLELGGEVRLHVQGPDNSEHDREDAAN